MRDVAIIFVCAFAFTANGKEVGQYVCSEDPITHPNCNQFYWCHHGELVERSCAPGLVFNTELQVCDWPKNVQCGDRKITEPSSNICGSDLDLVAHENCNQFYVCKQGELITKSCPLNLFFNTDLEVCDWPQNVQCGNRKIAHATRSIRNRNSQPICAFENTGVHFIAHENFCNQYYMCFFGVYSLLTCPANTLYNPDTRACDTAENVYCGRCSSF